MAADEHDPGEEQQGAVAGGDATNPTEGAVYLNEPGGEVGASDTSAILGGDEQELAANTFLRTMASAARSFLLYDTSNDAIRKFLESLEVGTKEYFDVYDDLDLEVRPFELMMKGKAVYLERDRERSLAFKLYRDGVSGLTIKKGVSWDEIIRLLEILSIRYVGVRLDEDDMVTLLWKAGFENISVRAVEGYVELEQETTLDMETSIMSEIALDDSTPYPWDFDFPLAVPETGSTPKYRPVGSDELAGIIDDLDNPDISHLALSLASKLQEYVLDATDSFSVEDAFIFYNEARLFFSHGDRMADLLKLAQLVESLDLSEEEDREKRDTFLGSFYNKDTLISALRTIGPEQEELPDGFVEVVEKASDNPLDLTLEILEKAQGRRQRQIGVLLAANYGDADTEGLISKALAATGTLAQDLVRVIGRVDGTKLMFFAERCLKNPDADLMLAILEESGSVGEELDPVRLQSLRSEYPQVRKQAFQQLRGRQIFGLFAALSALAKKGVGLTAEEGVLYGEELVRLGPARALHFCSELLGKASFLGATRTLVDDQARLIGGALRVIPGPKAAELLSALVNQVSVNVKDEIEEARGRQRLIRRGDTNA
ncbi:MAG: hypothetical protein CMH54_15195 [Myxococcales bacterium]|nr:hypothetical protein [Myxococcales bacterium]